MYRVLDCLTTQHDYRLLILAVMVCAVESFTAFSIYCQVRESRGYLDRRWLAVAGLCTGGSIWATHFIAMLAYGGDVRTSYEPLLTVVSLLLAFLITTFAFVVASSGRRLHAAAGGAIIGLGTAAMHFTGMRALIVAGTMSWDYQLAGASVLLGVAFATAGMLACHHWSGIKAVTAGASMLTLGIISLHMVAMAAVTVVPDPTVSVSALHFSNSTLAIAILVITLLVIGAGFIAAVQESRAARETVLTTRELVNAATEALVLAHRGIIVDANRRAIELWGSPLEDLLGKRMFGDLLTGQPPAAGDDGVFTLETYLKAANGGTIPVEIVRQPLHAAMRASEVYAISDLRALIQTTDRLRRMNDELQAQEAELRMQNMRFNTALTHMTLGLCMFDGEQRMVISNRRYAELYGLSLDQVKPGTRLREVIQARIDNGIFAGASPDEYMRERLTSMLTDIDMIQELNDGRSIAISLRQMPGGGYVSTHEDITERRRIEARLAHMAHHDPLTDLPNRVLLRQTLEKALGGSRRGDGNLAVLMLDLDRFKEVNDTLGHLVGDALLKAVAERLRKGMRQTATVARFGGDEFCVVDSFHPKDDPEALPRRIQEIIGEPMELEGHTVSVSTSIGIAMAPLHGMDPDELLKRADLALYRAKSDVRGSYRVFEPEMDAALQARRALEQDLREALKQGQLELYYQPIVRLDNNEITAFEALIRWMHPVRGVVPPDAFLPLAEETGLILNLTEWVLQEACAEAATWPEHIKVAVNLSVSQFKSRSMMPAVTAALEQTGLSPQRLELEITETVMLNDVESAFAAFRQLRQLGVRIVLDDFGTGFSSLSYLLRFPFDKIKIDRSFVADLAQEGSARVLVRSLIQMGRGLGVDVTAEGIETCQQLELMRAEGCTEIQGHLISTARPADEIRQFCVLLRPQSAVA
jgi:diguanylate cyclase (GGDEF)-like protein